MEVTVISIGDELLVGQVINTLAADMARILDTRGWEIQRVLTVGDTEEAITKAVKDALATTKVVITTGGLGPTRDDITKKVLCDIFGGKLVEDPATLENVKDIVSRRGFRLNGLTAAQALVPSSCRVIQNRVGTAPIMWFERDGHTLVAMPGVPFETTEMLKREVFPKLLEHYPSAISTARATLIVTGYTESGLAEYIAKWEDSLPAHLHLAYLPRPGLVRLRIDGHHPDSSFIDREVRQYADSLQSLLGNAVVAKDDLTPAEILLNICRGKGLSLTTAESCTGGNIAHELTMVAGCSDVFNGGVVAYSNNVKKNLLGVKAESLEQHGAVSIPVVEQMAQGACHATKADVAVATSGIAGPGGATPGKPVGTVCIAVATPRGVISSTEHFPGNRSRVIDAATIKALTMAITALNSEGDC